MVILDLDLETRSTVHIKRGTHRYAEGSEIILTAWGIYPGPIQVYDNLHDWYMPQDLADALEDPSVMVRSHGPFDPIIMNYHGYEIKPERHICTMALARSCSLPGSLDKLCKLLEVPPELVKLDTGKELIKLFCIPNKKGAYNDPKDYPKEWAFFKEYAGHDLVAMREVVRRLPTNNFDLDSEARAIYDTINNRGFKVDIELATSAIEHISFELENSKETTAELTSENVGSVTQTKALLNYIIEKTGKFITDLKGSTVATLLKDGDLPKAVCQLLELRQNICKSSTSKYKRVLECVCADGYIRGSMVFNGALRTRRNTGAIFQPLNLPRPTVKGNDLEDGINLLKYNMGYTGRKSIMPLCSSALRGVIVAPEGKKIVVSDWANVEGREAAWYSGESWKVRAFRDFDNGMGADLYKLSYATMMNRVVEEVNDDDERNTGKVSELALQYGGSVSAFLVFALVYNLNIAELARKLQITNVLAWEKAVKSYEYAWKNGRLLGLDEFTYKRIAYIVQAWRLAHPKIVSKWYDLDNKCKRAIRLCLDEVDPVDPFMHGRFLIVPLPSGQWLMYLDAKVDDRGITFTDGRFGTVRTYGSKIFENVIQSMNRDILCACLPECVKQGYDPRLTIYDEIVTYTPDLPEYSQEGLSLIMTAGTSWTMGLPLAAKGFEAYRYRKG